MTEKMTVRLTGGQLGLRNGKVYKKGDTLEISKNPDDLKGALKHVFQAGRLVPVEITMAAGPMIVNEQKTNNEPVPKTAFKPETTKTKESKEKNGRRQKPK